MLKYKGSLQTSYSLQSFPVIIKVYPLKLPWQPCTAGGYFSTIVSWKSTHPLIWPNFLFRVKVYSNVHPAWSELHVAIGVQSRSMASSALHICIFMALSLFQRRGLNSDYVHGTVFVPKEGVELWLYSCNSGYHIIFNKSYEIINFSCMTVQ